MTAPTDPAVAEFLALHTHDVEDVIHWPYKISFRLRSYLSDDLPPLDYITSARTMIFRGDDIMVLANEDGEHIMPGGRREPGEALLDTLRREVLEETGLEIEGIQRLGFSHFFHLSPKPDPYPYPYPDFFAVMHLADAGSHVPGARLENDYEREARFVPALDMLAQVRSNGERMYLEAALRLRGGLPG